MGWVNLELSKEVHDKAKKKAVDEGLPLKVFLIKVIENGVGVS